jgi:hypothetical protein
MNEKNVEAIKSILPEAFGEEFRRFGGWMDIGDGWFGLVKQMVEEIKQALESNPIVGEYPFSFQQIKEKFGQLRVYTTANWELRKDIDDIVAKAEEESANICEECGKPGKLRPISWVRCLCEEHYQEKLAQ